MKGILFKSEMVRAIIADIKTETRRIGGLEEVNKNPNYWVFLGNAEKVGMPRISFAIMRNKNSISSFYFRYKYQPGDIVYVKETYLIDKIDGIYYRADAAKMEDYNPKDCKWKSAMFMPEKFSRIHLKIKSVHIKRLQYIDNNGAISEGTPDIRTPENGYDMRDCYGALWNSINKTPYSWNDNPWVAVYKFERV